MCSLENQLLITIYLIGNTAWHDTDYTTRRKLERTNASGFRIVDIGGWNAMNLIKLILTLLGLIFGVMLFVWHHYVAALVRILDRRYCGGRIRWLQAFQEG